MNIAFFFTDRTFFFQLIFQNSTVMMWFITDLTFDFLANRFCIIFEWSFTSLEKFDSQWSVKQRYSGWITAWCADSIFPRAIVSVSIPASNSSVSDDRGKKCTWPTVLAHLWRPDGICNIFFLPFLVNCLGETRAETRIVEVLTFIDRVSFCVL